MCNRLISGQNAAQLFIDKSGPKESSRQDVRRLPSQWLWRHDRSGLVGAHGQALGYRFRWIGMSWTKLAAARNGPLALFTIVWTWLTTLGPAYLWAAGDESRYGDVWS